METEPKELIALEAKTSNPIYGYLIIAGVFLLQSFGCFYLGRLYERNSGSATIPAAAQRIDNLNRSIHDTSEDHHYNLTKQAVKEKNLSIDNKANKQLDEIKNNPGYNWQLVRNDSLLNAWRFFEAEVE